LEYHLLLARDLKLIPDKDYEELTQETTEIKRILTVFIQKLKAESAQPPQISNYLVAAAAALGSTSRAIFRVPRYGSCLRYGVIC